MDRSDVLRLLAGFLGILAAAVGGFAVFIGGALQSLDSGPRLPAWVTIAAPLAALVAALGAAAVARRAAPVAAGLYAAAAVFLAVPLAFLGLRAGSWLAPVVLLAAAALAFASARARR